MNGKIAQTAPAEPAGTPGKEKTPTQTNRRITTRQIAIAGICGATGMVLAFTPLGLIPVPNLAGAATTLHIPAIVAGVFGGPIVGAFTGLILAISSWILYSGQFLTFCRRESPGSPSGSFSTASPDRSDSLLHFQILLTAMDEKDPCTGNRCVHFRLFGFGNPVLNRKPNASSGMVADRAPYSTHCCGNAGRSGRRRSYRPFAWRGDMVAVVVIDCFYQRRKCSCFHSMGVSSLLVIGTLGYYSSRVFRSSWGGPLFAALAGTLMNTVGVLGIIYVFGDIAMRPALIPIILLNPIVELGLAIVVITPLVAGLRKELHYAFSR